MDKGCSNTNKSTSRQDNITDLAFFVTWSVLSYLHLLLRPVTGLLLLGDTAFSSFSYLRAILSLELKMMMKNNHAFKKLSYGINSQCFFFKKTLLSTLYSRYATFSMSKIIDPTYIRSFSSFKYKEFITKPSWSGGHGQLSFICCRVRLE